MKFRIALSLVAALAMTLFTFADSASAQRPGYDFGIGFGYARDFDGFNRGFAGRRAIVGRGLAGFGGSFRAVNNYDIPYFALHPPVYYSGQIVPRAYGVSPFAAPPGIRPVEMSMPAPKIINNPYVNPGKKAGKKQEISPSDKLPKKQKKKKKKKAPKGEAKTDDKSAHIINPFFQQRVSEVAAK